MGIPLVSSDVWDRLGERVFTCDATMRKAGFLCNAHLGIVEIVL